MCINTGYQTCAFHTGTTSTNSACCWHVCASTLPIMFHGGLADVLNSAQFIVNVSVVTIADDESRVTKDRSDWMLCPDTFHQINKRLGPLEVDLFASRLTHQLPTCVSWRSDPVAVFSTPTRCCTLRRMFSPIHHSHSSLARQFSCGEFVDVCQC